MNTSYWYYFWHSRFLGIIDRAGNLARFEKGSLAREESGFRSGKNQEFQPGSDRGSGLASCFYGRIPLISILMFSGTLAFCDGQRRIGWDLYAIFG